MSLPTPRRRTSVRILAVSLVLGGTMATIAAARTPVAPAPTVPVAGGVTFTYKVTSSSTEKRAKEAKDMLATVRLQDGNARVDYVSGQGPMGQKGAYILVTSSPAQFAIVNDKDKQVMIMEPSMLGSTFGAMMNNPMLKLTIKNAKFSYKDLGAGEEILGYKTRRVRVYNSSDTEMKIVIKTMKYSNSDSSDQWIAQGINVDVDEAALAAWGKAFTSGLKTTSPELAAEFAKYDREYGRNGLALKSTTWSTQTDEKGKATTDVVTMEVTDLKKGAIDAAMFKIPSNYKVTDLSAMAKSGGSN